MSSADLPGAVAASGAAFGQDLSDATAESLWRGRVAHPASTDPKGIFVAERDGEVIAVASAIRRERLLVLSLLAVAPGSQSAGAGRAVLAPALAYGDELPAALIPSSEDPRALALYASHGFELHPTLEATGDVDRRALPRAHPDLRRVDAGDLERLEPISRAVRGGAHTRDLQFALSRHATILRLADRGFVVVDDTRVWLLAALDEDAAQALLWAALEHADTRAADGTDHPPVAARWLTAAQQWAVRPLLTAGLDLHIGRALAVRGRPGPLAPFLPSAPFG